SEILLETPVYISTRITDRFAVLPKRWIVERTFAWMNHGRRLSKDYESLPGHSES
ncbi:MAG: transposase, partial [bacterium]|nr:transposase [bacterium]